MNRVGKAGRRTVLGDVLGAGFAALTVVLVGSVILFLIALAWRGITWGFRL